MYIALLCSQCTMLHTQNYGGNYDWRMIGGGPLQLVSLHIGSVSGSLNWGYSIGASIGWNYISSLYNTFDAIEHVFDMGLRLKYNFIQMIHDFHSVGAEIYLHFPASTTNLFANKPQPFSLILGAGAVFPDNSPNFNGRYVEIGVGVFKYFVINVNITYRFTFLPANDAGLNRRVDSLQVEFSIF